MTASIATNVERRRRGGIDQRVELLTVARGIREALLEELQLATRVQFPSPRYREDPVAFAREILGIEPWSKQVEILELVRDHKRVAVKSGHRVGKSASVAILALWFYCSFEDARVVLSSTTSRQVDQILWREVKMLRARSGRCVQCKADDPNGQPPCPHSTMIDGEMRELARAGLRSGFREIQGFTARESEAVAGVAGRHLLFLIDEASGVPDFIFEAMAGNRAGGARIVLFGNPTRNKGEFYEAFSKKAEFYKTMTISSADSPNVIEGRTVIPGLADLDWIEEMRAEWGEDSAFYSVRVKGEFAEKEEGRIFSLHAIAEAEARWYDTPEAGRLTIGVDPAGPTGSGDETAFAVRRGMRVLALLATRGLTEEAHVDALLDLVRKYRVPREVPVVLVDREGSVGARVYGFLSAYAQRRRKAPDEPPIELHGVRSSERAQRHRELERVRDELAQNLEIWMREGGAIPEDAFLEKELHELEWESTLTGKTKLISKAELRKRLKGRSPDRYDALSLCVWEPSTDDDSGSDEADDDDDDDDLPRGRALDPYAGADSWRRG